MIGNIRSGSQKLRCYCSAFPVALSLQRESPKVYILEQISDFTFFITDLFTSLVFRVAVNYTHQTEC